MNKIKITVMKITKYNDLISLYENKIENACNLKVGDTFIVENAQKPENFCDSAWETLYPFVVKLANGEGNFFDGWMKNPLSAMLSCNDGMRPVSFYIEVLK